MKILIVDDVSTNRKLLRWMLEESDHEIIEASSGEEGLASFYTERPDLILLDIVMPGIDGYEVARVIKKFTGDAYVPIIFITAINDDDALTKCLACGGDDFLAKPFNEAILKAKITAHTRIQDLNNQVNQKNKALLYHQSLIQREHEIVEHVFKSALSENFYDSGQVNYYLSPMSKFNGDVFLITPSPSGGIYLMLGDFTGHGLSAAIGALPLSRTFFTMARKGLSIGDIAQEMNALIISFLPDYMFCAATLLELNAHGDEAILWCGGLPDAVVLSPSGKLEHTLPSMHPPLGVMDNTQFERGVYTLKLQTGSRIYVHSDGVTESKNAQGQMLGTEYFHTMISEAAVNRPDERLSYITDKLFNYSDNNAQDDDISLIEIICKPTSYTQPKQLRHSKNLPPWKLRFNIEVEHMRYGNPPADILSMISLSTGLAGHKDILHTILTELYVNALEHGVLKLPSSLKNSDDGFIAFQTEKEKRLNALVDGSIQVMISQEKRNDNDVVKIWMHDSGPGFDFSSVVASQDDEHCYGRGLMLVKALCNDEVFFKDKGSTIEVYYSV